MSDLIRREDALRVTLAYASSYSAEQAETAIRALPAVQPDAREAALRDIARQKKTDEMDTEYDVEYADFEGGYNAIIDVARRALPAVSAKHDFAQPGHVNETPKSEHDAANVLTLTAERDRLREALLCGRRLWAIAQDDRIRLLIQLEQCERRHTLLSLPAQR